MQRELKNFDVKTLFTNECAVLGTPADSRLTLTFEVFTKKVKKGFVNFGSKIPAKLQTVLKINQSFDKMCHLKR